MSIHNLCDSHLVRHWSGEDHNVVFLMEIQQQPSTDFCDVKYSKVPKRGGAIIRGGTIFRGNTVFSY